MRVRLPLALAVILAGCGHKPPAPQTPISAVAPAPPPPRGAVKPASPWPMPMRVMVWGGDGIEQIGTLPDAPPPSLPALYFVEPTRTVDDATLAQIVTALRSEHVPGLSLRGQAVKQRLGALRDLPELAALVLDDTDVDSASLAGLAVKLRRLYLARTQVDDAAASWLAREQPELEVLDVEDCAIGDAGVKAIVGLGKLEAVNLAGTRITDAGGAELGALGKLQILDLGGTKVAAKTIAAIRPLALRQLFLDHTRAGKEIATLSDYAPGITRFDVSMLDAYKPTDADVGWLATAPNLVEAGLSGARVHDKLVLAIAKLPQLREIRLAGAPITNAAVKALAALPKLEEVDLAETPVDDASAAALLAMTGMRALRLDRTPITDAALRAKPSPALVELYLSRTKVSDTGLAILDATPKLEALGLGETVIGDATLARIGKLTGLVTLVLSKVRASRESLVELGGLTQLERLYLDDTRADDTTLVSIVKLRNLRVLHLAGTDVSDGALPTLRSFTQLDELTVGDTRMRDAVADLASWPRLRTLSLQGLEVSDAAVPLLAKRPTLVTLDLSSTDIKDPAPLVALPHLRVLGLSVLRLSPAGEASAKRLAAKGIEVVR